MTINLAQRGEYAVDVSAYSIKEIEAIKRAIDDIPEVQYLHFMAQSRDDRSVIARHFVEQCVKNFRKSVSHTSEVPGMSPEQLVEEPATVAPLLQVGDSVRHSRYGQGVVREPRAPNNRCTVYFKVFNQAMDVRIVDLQR
jgi:hypothetical protein